MSAHSTSHIVQSLVANLGIAVIKAVAAFFTGSGAMLAEAIHSGADVGNQVLLLLGVRSASRPPDARYPLGHGRNLYFWSFMVALLLFTGGGVFSLYEGFHKITHPEPLDHVWIGVGVLAVSLLIEGAATLSNLREIDRRRDVTPLLHYLRNTKDSDLVVVFGENSAAALGLVCAIAALALASLTGDPRWDGAGSALIGLVLVGVAVFLAVEVKSLLVGEAADPEVQAALVAAAGAQPHILAIRGVITVQQGPGEVMVALKASFTDGLTVSQLYAEINAFEAAVRASRPEVKWLFVEPDAGT